MDEIKPKHPGGRPTIYTPELGALICERVATNPLPIKSVCQADDLPAYETICKWQYKIPEFGHLLAQARAARALLMEEECFEIADNSTNDWMDKEVRDGKIIRVVDHEHVNRSRLRIETRRYHIERMTKANPTEGPVNNQQINISIVMNKLTQNPFGARLIECAQQLTSQASEPLKLTSVG